MTDVAIHDTMTVKELHAQGRKVIQSIVNYVVMKVWYWTHVALDFSDIESQYTPTKTSQSTTASESTPVEESTSLYVIKVWISEKPIIFNIDFKANET